MALTLTAVETAIEALMSGGQSVTVEGVMYSQASLAALVSLRKQLKTEGGTGGADPFGYRVRPLKPPEH